MRRARPKDLEGKLPASFRRDNRPLPSPPSSPPPVEPTDIDWGLLSSTHTCCVCGEAHVPPTSEEGSNVGSSNSTQHRRNPSSQAPPRRGGGPGGADESFVVLPDSTPILSESYFSLSRNPGVASGSSITSSTTTRIAHEINYAAGGPPRAGSRLPPSSVGNGSTLAASAASAAASATPGSQLLLDSGYYGYAHGYGGGGYGSGFGGGWTESGFGVGSSMLESIVQISHAGLSDNVRRESLLCELSKRPARALDVDNGVDGVVDGAGAGAGAAFSAGAATSEQGGRAFSSERSGEGVPVAAGREEAGGDDHPTLCCHCYASLLEQIDEDSRVADRETLAYRDFAELLDAIDDDGSGLDSDGETPSPTPATPDIARITRDAAADGGGGGASGSPGNNNNPSSTIGTPATASGDAAQSKRGAAGEKGSHSSGVVKSPADDSDGSSETAEPRSARSPFAQALQMAERTSVQLRTELSSLEAQRGALCSRGSDAWAALSELAYARGVLGNECRELLQVSREVAEKAAHLSERSALSDLFSIRHMDGFPSINGYRLGKSPDDKRHLQWNEINAAWGEAVLLIRCVSNAVDFHSRRFRLVPLNCASRIIELARGARSPDRQNPDSAPVAIAHDLFSSGGRGSDKSRLLAAMGAFLACSSEAIACVERRVLERRLEGEMSAGAACVAWSDVGMPYKQTEDAVGGVAITSLKSQASWKAWLCQLVKNLEWAVTAASSLCVA